MKCSILGLGTVSLGTEYGIEAPGDHECPNETDAIGVLRAAADAGINFFDTAPAYGRSERLVGEALGSRPECILATKLTVPRDEQGRVLEGAELSRTVRSSIEASCRALRRPCIDILQIHNATREILERGDIAGEMLTAINDGFVRALGATVYTEDEALAAIECGVFDVLQVPYSILDQRPAARVFRAASKAGVAIIARSILLKGALSSKANWLPDHLFQLRAAAVRVMHTLAGSWESMPAVAVRFAVSSPDVTCTLAGARTLDEVRSSIAASEEGPLSDHLLELAKDLAIDDDILLNPACWDAMKNATGEHGRIDSSPYQRFGEANPRIVLRCGCAPETGLGHVSRMMTLAHTLRDEHRAIVEFALDHNPSAEARVTLAGFAVTTKVPSVDEAAFLNDVCPDEGVLVLDLKHNFSPPLVRSLRARAAVVVIDHPCDGMHEANLVVFPTGDLIDVIADDPAWRKSNARLKHGPQYAIIDPALPSARRQPGDHIVVTTGASDPRGVLVSMMPALMELAKHIEIRALVGEVFAHGDALDVWRDCAPSTLQILPFAREHICRATACITTYGVTVYECMAMGVPSLVVGHTRENAEASGLLATRYNCTVDLGFVDKLAPHRIVREVSALLQEDDRRREMAARSRQIVDGRGSTRVAEFIMELMPIKLASKRTVKS